MSIEVGGTATRSTICQRCGIAYGKAKGNFPTCYGSSYKGTGRLSVCNNCIDEMYNKYMGICGDPKASVRQLCRKLDIYWNGPVFDSVSQRSTNVNVVRAYMQKTSTTNFVGKSYDDTLKEEGTLWSFSPAIHKEQVAKEEKRESDEKAKLEEEKAKYKVSKEVKRAWGPGYDDQMYWELEQRRQFWMAKLPEDTELDVTKEALIRQICNLELDINRDRQAGKSIDKNVTVLNNLVGKIMDKDDASGVQLMNTPLGVWLYRYENQKPLPKLDKTLSENKIKKYIFTWMGHLCKMLGIKNGYMKLYEEEIERLKVNRPEFEDEDEEDLLIDSYSDEQDIDEEVNVYDE